MEINERNRIYVVKGARVPNSYPRRQDECCVTQICAIESAKEGRTPRGTGVTKEPVQTTEGTRKEADCWVIELVGNQQQGSDQGWSLPSIYDCQPPPRAP